MLRERLVCVDPRTTCYIFWAKNSHFAASSAMFGIKIFSEKQASNALENCGIQGQWRVLLASKHPHGRVTFSREY